MVLSMTGFGKSTETSGVGDFYVEIKSLNNRFLEINYRGNKDLAVLEIRIRDYIKSKVKRGRIDVFIKYLPGINQNVSVVANSALAVDYYNAVKAVLRDLKENCKVEGLEENVSLYVENILRLPGVVEIISGEVDEEILWQALMPAVDEAMKEVISGREKEGEALKKELILNVDELKSYLNGIREIQTDVVERVRKRLIETVEQLKREIDVDLTEDRLNTEIVLYADKMDVSEEVIRIASHIEGFISTLEESAEKGKKLDFIIQELFREINTIGNKAKDSKISNLVVQVKVVLEKMRELIQNIE